MEPALKQRLIGAIVLVALAVIFLPMLIKGPAPESGVADIQLDLPAAPPREGFQTRELPLVTPSGAAPAGGVVGMEPDDEGRLPTVDTREQVAKPEEDGMMPAATVGGDYAVSFGTYSSADDAGRVIAALKAASLPGYQEAVSGRDNRTLHRVRIGPFATQADAEAARIRAGRIRNDVEVRVVVLNADAATPVGAEPAEVATAPEPEAPKPAPPKVDPAPQQPAPQQSVPQQPVATAPPPASSAPAAATVGFAVQLGAFSQAAEADKLRDRARAAGFSAFTERVNTDKGTLSRVRVGPVSTRAEAEQLKAQVAGKLGITGMVRPHP
ncbi:SPOR domain-containing protein [Marilutibacter alkalisoli]|uniref:Sporulation protein n=1 Tax=Marilutibacter alkalisoli TaxID=2591633 RepID=A0A514BQ91_9GAMM|nr:SPOR domain-containing protein [Lysobacter alkalisoli]QDH69526.1 sporulation protein [Lysobacter alkalisoli]